MTSKLVILVDKWLPLSADILTKVQNMKRNQVEMGDDELPLSPDNLRTKLQNIKDN